MKTEFFGVEEIVDRTQNAIWNASIATVCLGLLTLFTYYILSSAINLTITTWNERFWFVLWSGIAIMSFWTFEFVIYRSNRFGPIVTRNSNLGYRDLADFVLSSGWGMSSKARIDRSIGRLTISNIGIDGFILYEWNELEKVTALSGNKILIKKKTMLPAGLQHIADSSILLRFSKEEDAMQFARLSADYLSYTLPS